MYGRDYLKKFPPSPPEAAPETPSQQWRNFNFRGHRSPAALSTGSATPSPLQQSIRDSHDEKTSTAPNHHKQSISSPRQRRGPRNRVSFLVSEQDISQARSRPSLLDLDEDEVDESATAGQDKPVSNSKRIHSQSSMSPDRYRKAPRTSARHSISSSRLSESVYFDAEEELVHKEPLLVIKEEASVEERQAHDAMKQMGGKDPSLLVVEEEDLDNTSIFYESEEDTENESDEDDDTILVMRDLPTVTATRRDRRFNPNHGLPCTPATAADAANCKSTAVSLRCYAESDGVYATLMHRLERMITLEQTAAFKAERQPLTATQLARTLRSFLRDTAVARVQTGEIREFVKHEVEWAEWIYGACKTGVMHVKTRGCRCMMHWKL